MAKDTFYFSHDYNARNDSKIKRLLSKHGYLGYGIYWAIIEDLYNNANALHLDYESIAFDLRTDEQTLESIINDFGLFVFENGIFGSLSVQKRLEERNEKSKKARNSALKRWNDANALHTHSDSNAIKERKGKENKVNENKLKENKDSIEFAEILETYPFEMFWDLYDKKVGRPKSELKWGKLSEKEKQEICDFIPRYIEAQPDKQFRQNPETFFNNRTWEDELIIKTNTNGKQGTNSKGNARDAFEVLQELRRQESDGI